MIIHKTVKFERMLHPQHVANFLRLKNMLLLTAAYLTGLGLFFLLTSAEASASIGIGKPNFSDLENMLIAYEKFMTGPFAKAAVISSIVVGMGAWLISPKEGFVGVAARITVAGVILMNATEIAKDFAFTAT